MSIEKLTSCHLCNCHNPIWSTVGKELFNEEKFDLLKEGLSEFFGHKPESAVYKGGTIRPMIDGKIDTVEALGIHEGKVVATGTINEVENKMNEKKIEYSTRTLAEGETLLPGLIDPHLHIVPTAFMQQWHDFGPFEGQYLKETYDTDELIKEIEEALNSIENDEWWLLGKMVDPSLMPFKLSKDVLELNKLVDIDYKLLDSVKNEKKRPILIMSASMHTAYLNTAALTAVWESNKDLQEKYKTVDDYITQTQGDLQEIAGIMPAIKTIPIVQLLSIAAGIFKQLTSMFDDAVSKGITSIYDAGMDERMKILLELYLFFHQKKVRIGCAHIINNLDDAKNLDKYEAHKEYKDVYRGNIKMVSDGSNQGLTGFQSESYRCEPKDNFGAFDFPADSHPEDLSDATEYIQMVDEVVNNKEWPLMIHANGDKAVTFAVDVYDEVLNGKSGIEKRHRIEHCSLLTEDQIKKMKEIGVSPSFLIGHVGYWGYTFSQAIFEEKAQTLDLCKSALDNGLRITLHSDHSVTPLGPLRMMEQAVTRRMEGAEGNDKPVLNPDECITVEQALRTVTTDAAWQIHADTWAGSLQDNFFADFVILAEDPITRANPVGMRDITVLETWKGGVQVYKNDSSS